MVVEGAGGVLVPMGQDWTVRDLIARLCSRLCLSGEPDLAGSTMRSSHWSPLGAKASWFRRWCEMRRSVPELPLNESRWRQRYLSCGTCGHSRAGPLPNQPELNCNWFAAIELLAQSGPIMNLADLVWRAPPEISG